VAPTRRGLQPETARGHQEATRALQLARALGADVVTVPADDVAKAIVAYAGEVGATQLIMGETTRPWLGELLGGSVVREVLRHTRDVDVYIARRGDG
jgi:two-component system sensor histidine kinase KdpD